MYNLSLFCFTCSSLTSFSSWTRLASRSSSAWTMWAKYPNFRDQFNWNYGFRWNFNRFRHRANASEFTEKYHDFSGAELSVRSSTREFVRRWTREFTIVLQVLLHHVLLHHPFLHFLLPLLSDVEVLDVDIRFFDVSFACAVENSYNESESRFKTED